MICCILLSAGLSLRFGSPKALARVGTTPVINLLLQNLAATSVDMIYVVLGSGADKIKPLILKHEKVNVVYNKDYNFGQTTSFQAGLKAFVNDNACQVPDGSSASSRPSGIMLLPVDYPLVKKETIEDLAAYYRKEHPLILIPTFDGRKGHPPVFSSCLIEEFLELGDNDGCHSVARKHLSQTVLLPVRDPGTIRSFNTPEEFQEIQVK